jgi:hypothetical protein
VAVGTLVSSVTLVGVPAANASANWSLVPSANNGTVLDMLKGVSCASAGSCTAVGFHGAPGDYRTLIESWNGKAWSLATSPNLGDSWNFLNGVSCVSARSCVAVGEYAIPGVELGTEDSVWKSLIESWNGSAWSVVPSPNISKFDLLEGVSCVSANACTAVGAYAAGSNERTLTESWNGRAWSVVPSPNHGSLTNILSGVSCVSARSCTAVGSSDIAAGKSGEARADTLIESWNGTAWSIASSPNKGSGKNVLSGVSCVSAAACNAVGQFDGLTAGGVVSRTIAESWNGTAWSIAPSSNRSTESNVLSGVSCTSASACRAVGWFQNTSGGAYRTLIESWTGTAWKVVSSPSRAPGSTPDYFLRVTGSALNGVSCVSPPSCQAAGFYDTAGGHDQTLVESQA